jgi:hypothetical protein
MVLTIPMMKPTTYSQRMFTISSHHATGTLMTAKPDGFACTTGSLRMRSSQTPVGSDSNTNGSVSIIVSMPIWLALALSMTAAVSGNASMVICAPNELISIDVHKRR